MTVTLRQAAERLGMRVAEARDYLAVKHVRTADGHALGNGTPDPALRIDAGAFERLMRPGPPPKPSKVPECAPPKQGPSIARNLTTRPDRLRGAVTVRQVAARLGVKPDAARERLRRALVHPIEQGGHGRATLWDGHEIEAWLAEEAWIGKAPAKEVQVTSSPEARSADLPPGDAKPRDVETRLTNGDLLAHVRALEAEAEHEARRAEEDAAAAKRRLDALRVAIVKLEEVCG